MTNRAISGADLPAPGGAYSQAVLSGRILAVAGQVGRDPASNSLRDGLEAQTEQAIANLVSVLGAAGCSLGDVIKTTCFLADITDFEVFNRVYAALVPEPRPARSTVGVQLAGGLLVEIDALAVVPPERT